MDLTLKRVAAIHAALHSFVESGLPQQVVILLIHEMLVALDTYEGRLTAEEAASVLEDLAATGAPSEERVEDHTSPSTPSGGYL